MRIYNTDSRTGLISSLHEVRSKLSPEETELGKLTDNALTELYAITNGGFARLELYPDSNQ